MPLSSIIAWTLKAGKNDTYLLSRAASEDHCALELQNLYVNV